MTVAAKRRAPRLRRLAELRGMQDAQAFPARRRRYLVISSALIATFGGIAPSILSSPPVGATTVGGLQARAKEIASQINAVDTKLAVLGEEYDQARLRVGNLDRAIVSEKGELASTKRSVSDAMAKLRKDAVAAYVSAGSSSGLSVLIGSNANTLPLQQTYMEAADSTISTQTTTLLDDEHQLGVRKATLSAAETSAAASEATVASAQNRARTLVGQLDSAQVNVRGKLAAAVARQEQIQQAQAAARAAAQRAAEATVRVAKAQPAPPVVTVPTPAPTAPAPSSSPQSSGGSQGELAVRAAESQIGVPYRWGGASPGEGFDCSGLAMWSWSQAGVDLPHSAQAQYDSIEHISFNQLEPGDLIFYASGGYIYHVIMYIGNGQAVQAEETGTTIQITPVWGGAYAAGRP